MDIYELADAQKFFNCNRCGTCCLQGGDIAITDADVHRIADFLGCPEKDRTMIPLAKDRDKNGNLYFHRSHPCFYYDKDLKACRIYPARPTACRQYPYLLFVLNGCTKEAMELCPQVKDARTRV